MGDDVVYSFTNGERIPKNKIYKARKGEVNYVAGVKSLELGIAEMKGKRRTQEDRLSYAELKEQLNLTDQEWEEVFIASYAELQAKAGQYPQQGSTAISVIQDGHKIHVANVGDSSVMLCVIDENNNVTLEHLNQVHSYLENENEKTRLKDFATNKKRKLSDFVNKNTGRLAGSLAVTRAIGDTAYELFGLSHEPDIIHIEYPVLTKGQRAFVIAGCDGLLDFSGGYHYGESIQKKTDNLKKIIQKYLLKNAVFELSGLSLHLAEEATKEQTLIACDNVSVIVSELGQDDRKVLNIYDGHGGAEVSQKLQDIGLDVLQKHIDRVIAKRAVDETETITTKQAIKSDIANKVSNYNYSFLHSRMVTSERLESLREVESEDLYREKLYIEYRALPKASVLKEALRTEIFEQNDIRDEYFKSFIPDENIIKDLEFDSTRISRAQRLEITDLLLNYVSDRESSFKYKVLPNTAELEVRIVTAGDLAQKFIECNSTEKFNLFKTEIKKTKGILETCEQTNSELYSIINIVLEKVQNILDILAGQEIEFKQERSGSTRCLPQYGGQYPGSTDS